MLYIVYYILYIVYYILQHDELARHCHRRLQRHPNDRQPSLVFFSSVSAVFGFVVSDPKSHTPEANLCFFIFQIHKCSNDTSEQNVKRRSDVAERCFSRKQTPGALKTVLNMHVQSGLFRTGMKQNKSKNSNCIVYVYVDEDEIRSCVMGC